MDQHRQHVHPLGEKLAKYLAARGLGSRRGCEVLIRQGVVAVNGVRQDNPATRVLTTDHIVCQGKPVHAGVPAPQLYLYHKPVGEVTTRSDPKGRQTVFGALEKRGLLAPEVLKSLISVGRLDQYSEGLLLLTNHRPLARFLEHPQNAIKRVYEVCTCGKLTQEHIKALQAGLVYEGITYLPVGIAGLSANSVHMLAHPLKDSIQKLFGYRMILREGKNREIRKMMAACGVRVARLMRVGFGPFVLEGVPPGALTSAPHDEVTKWCKRAHCALKSERVQ